MGKGRLPKLPVATPDSRGKEHAQAQKFLLFLRERRTWNEKSESGLRLAFRWSDVAGFFFQSFFVKALFSSP